MVKTSNPLLAGDACGSVGSFNLFHNRFGSSTRKKAIPKKEKTGSQQANRYLFQRLQKSWTSLSVEQKEKWENLAKNKPQQNCFGQSFLNTGKDWYVKINTFNYLFSGTLLAVPQPFLPTWKAFPKPFVEFNPATGIEAYSDNGMTTSEGFFFYVTKNLVLSKKGSFDKAPYYKTLVRLTGSHQLLVPVDELSVGDSHTLIVAIGWPLWRLPLTPVTFDVYPA